MHDIFSQLKLMKRPKLLIRAAKFAVGDYKRGKHLKQVFPGAPLSDDQIILASLFNLEAEIDSGRKAGRADYSVSHHVNVLAAIMAEAQMLFRAPNNV